MEIQSQPEVPFLGHVSERGQIGQVLARAEQGVRPDDIDQASRLRQDRAQRFDEIRLLDISAVDWPVDDDRGRGDRFDEARDDGGEFSTLLAMFSRVSLR